mgnify:CR=1 FL=1
METRPIATVNTGENRPNANEPVVPLARILTRPFQQFARNKAGSGIVLLGAAVIALIGALLVLLYARGADERAVAAASPTTAYVSNVTVPAGTMTLVVGDAAPRGEDLGPQDRRHEGRPRLREGREEEARHDVVPGAGKARGDDRPCDDIATFWLERRIALLEPALAKEVTDLMAYPPDVAGGLMDPRVTTFRAGATARAMLVNAAAQQWGAFWAGALSGKAGENQEHHQVYDREKQACRRCRSVITKAKFQSRTTYFCEQCQV